MTKGHTLIIPKRHVRDYFGLNEPEITAINSLIFEEKEKLSLDISIEGYNVGANCGGLLVKLYFTIHTSDSQEKGDVKNPGGGVKASY